jgi:hypothetical protein
LRRSGCADDQCQYWRQETSATVRLVRYQRTFSTVSQ